MISIFAVFVVSFLVYILNLGANQGIVKKSQSLLQDNYPSVKYSFEMLKIINDINSIILSEQFNEIDSPLIADNWEKTESDLVSFEKNLTLQKQNVTETGEQELTNLLSQSFEQFRTSFMGREYLTNYDAFYSKYHSLKQYVLSIYDLNVKLLETKNETIKSSATKILNIQEKVGIAGLTLLALSVFLLPLLLLTPIDKLAARMIVFYKKNFGKELNIETNHELEKLEQIFEGIVLESAKEEKVNKKQS